MLKKPIFLTLILSGIPLFFILLEIILKSLASINISPIIVCAADITCLLLVSWLYISQYNKPIPKEIRFTTAKFCTIFSFIILFLFTFSFDIYVLQLILSKFGLTIKSNDYFPLFVPLFVLFLFTGILALISAAIRSVCIYFGLAIFSKFFLNMRNYAKNKNYISKQYLEPDEKIIFRASKKYTLGSFIGDFIGIGLWYIILCFQNNYWNEVPYLKFVIICLLIGSIVMYIDYQFFADFLITNKRIIFKRIYYLGNVKDILLEDIESVSSKIRFNKGRITVASKKGFILNSIVLYKPAELQEMIEKYLLELKIHSAEN